MLAAYHKAKAAAAAAVAHKARAEKFNFPLFNLPDEIWLRIGEFAVLESEPFTPTQLLPSSDLKPDERKARAQPAITRVCRALRKELLPYYYANISLLLVAPAYYPRAPGARFPLHGVKEWLERVDKANRVKIEGLKVIARRGMVERQRLAQVWEEYWGVRRVWERVEDGETSASWEYRVRFLEV